MKAIQRLIAVFLSGLVLAGLPATQSGAQERQPARGMFLVSSPALTGTAFGTSVVLLVHHNEEGSIGVIVNRPTNIGAFEAFPELAALEDYDSTIYYGGPVAPARPVFLIRSEALLPEGNVQVLADVYLQGDLEAFDALPEEIVHPARIRVYAGHAEWGPGQLAAEVAAGSWQVIDARTSQVFSSEPLQLWREVRLAGSAEVVQLQP